MKLILDEWIVREVIDTLYMARTTFLGITGLDSPQEVEKKSANETAITRRISKAIDMIQQSEQSPVPNDLEEAVMEGWIAVDSDTTGKRRVTLFSIKPVRDVLTEYKYWAATRPRYESIKLDSNAFPNLKWEDEPKKVKLFIVKEDEKWNKKTKIVCDQYYSSLLDS